MSLPLVKNRPHLVPKRASSDAVPQATTMKVLVPYDGSESAEIALDSLKRAGLPASPDVLVPVTNVWLPLSPYEITRAVSTRRMRVLTAGKSSFVPALRDYEEQRVLSLEAERRINSIFPLGTVRAEAMRDTGSVANEILRRAKQWGIELIIVGSKTAPSAQITDYAGPALKIAREAHCSVRIARASDRSSNSPMRLLICIDKSQAAADVIHEVARRVWPQGSEARLVVSSEEGPRDSRRDSEATVKLNRAEQMMHASGLSISSAITDGRSPDALLHEARKFAADCIFISSGAHPAFDGQYGQRGLSKTAETLALGADCSVEVVRSRNFEEPPLLTAA